MNNILLWAILIVLLIGFGFLVPVLWGIGGIILLCIGLFVVYQLLMAVGRGCEIFTDTIDNSFDLTEKIMSPIWVKIRPVIPVLLVVLGLILHFGLFFKKSEFGTMLLMIGGLLCLIQIRETLSIIWGKIRPVIPATLVIFGLIFYWGGYFEKSQLGIILLVFGGLFGMVQVVGAYDSRSIKKDRIKSKLGNNIHLE